MQYSTPTINVNERVTKPLSKILQPSALPKPRRLLFKNVNVIDVVKNQTITRTNVLVSNGVIETISQDIFDTSGSVEIDCHGKYLCPGLFDNHVHVTVVPGEKDLEGCMNMVKTKSLMLVGNTCEMMLSRGFTTIRDCGGCESYVSKAIELGIILGPRMVIAGHAISQTGGHGDTRSGDVPGLSYDSCSCHVNFVGVIADGVEEVYKALREELRRGANFIKIMGGGGVASPTDKISNVQYCEDEIQAIVRVANSYGTYVTAHAYTPQLIQNCITNGVKGIEHGNLIDDRTAKLMAEKNCYLTPTLVTYKIMASDQFQFYVSESTQKKNQQVLIKGLESLQIASRNGVTMCYGSDLLGPLVAYQTQEFFIRSKVLTNHDILMSATVNPAKMNGLDDKLGQIKPGYIADLILLDKNPLEDITVLDEPELHLNFVMKDGLIYKTYNSLVDGDFKSRDLLV